MPQLLASNGHDALKAKGSCGDGDGMERSPLYCNIRGRNAHSTRSSRPFDSQKLRLDYYSRTGGWRSPCLALSSTNGDRFSRARNDSGIRLLNELKPLLFSQVHVALAWLKDRLLYPSAALRSSGSGFRSLDVICNIPRRIAHSHLLPRIVTFCPIVIARIANHVSPIEHRWLSSSGSHFKSRSTPEE